MRYGRYTGDSGAGGPGTTLLIVDDDPTVIDGVVKFVPRDIRCLTASTNETALAAITSHPAPDGLAVDVVLDHERGRDVLDYWLTWRPAAPALVMTAHYDDPRLAEYACERNCRFLAKPFGGAAFRAFVADVVARRRARLSSLERQDLHEADDESAADECDPRPSIATEWAERLRLTPTERTVLLRSMLGASRAELRRALHLSEVALKRHVHGLVQKSGTQSLEGAARRGLHDALTKLLGRSRLSP